MILPDTSYKYHVNRAITLEDIQKFNCPIFFLTPHSKAFQKPLKSLSNSHAAKMVDWNFFHKKSKIMMKMCLSNPKAHPESVLDI